MNDDWEKQRTPTNLKGEADISSHVSFSFSHLKVRDPCTWIEPELALSSIKESKKKKPLSPKTKKKKKKKNTLG